MAIGGVGATFSPTAGQSSQSNAGVKYADRAWASDSPAAQVWKDRVQIGVKGYSSSDMKSAFAGYEQWIEQQGLQIMQKAADDMGKTSS